MITLKNIKDNLNQILAITEKNLKLELRYKATLPLTFISPVLAMIFPLIVMAKFLEYRNSLGIWNQENFLIYQFTAVNLSLIIGIRHRYPQHLFREKNWLTLSALIIAPFNRINLLFGIFFTHLILIFPSFVTFFIISYIIYPIQSLTILVLIISYLLCALVFSGVGIILAGLAVSNENLWTLISFSLRLLFFISCVSYPFEIFPSFLQFFIKINPLYYIFDIMRIIWIQDNIYYTFSSYFLNFTILLVSALILPFLGVLIFNKIYRKYGIVGY